MSSLVRFFSELRDRRIIQIVASYAAAAWIGLEVVDQLVDRGIFPDWVYLILLVWFLGGFLAAAVIGWYHGEKGAQEVTKSEVVLLALVAVGTVGATVVTAQDYREAPSTRLRVWTRAGSRCSTSKPTRTIWPTWPTD